MEFNEQQPSAMQQSAKTKSNKGLAVACCVLAVAVLALGGFVIYDKVIRKDSVGSNSQTSKCVTYEDTEEESGAGESNAIEAGKTEGFVVDLTAAGQIYVTKKGDVYYVPDSHSDYEGLKKINFANQKGQENIPTAKKGSYKLDSKEISNFEPINDGEDFVVDGYKIEGLSDVVSVSELGYGQQPIISHVAFVDTKGEVVFLNVNLVSGRSSFAYNSANKNISHFQTVNMGSGVGAIVHYRDGSYASFAEDEITQQEI